MHLEYRKLDESEIANALQSLPNWKVESGQLARNFTFETYKDGLVFATAVGFLADKLNHHPDMRIGYAKAWIGMNTHDVEGLSPFDFELARQIDDLRG